MIQDIPQAHCFLLNVWKYFEVEKLLALLYTELQVGGVLVCKVIYSAGYLNKMHLLVPVLSIRQFAS